MSTNDLTYDQPGKGEPMKKTLIATAYAARDIAASPWTRWLGGCLSVIALAWVASTPETLVGVLVVAALTGMLLGRPQVLFGGVLAATFVAYSTGMLTGDQITALVPNLASAVVFCLTVEFGRRQFRGTRRFEEPLGVAYRAS